MLGETGASEGDKPDVPMALLDTGCTRCMHGDRWRKRFEVAVLEPNGRKISFTGETRKFSSCFGGQAGGAVVRIPVGLGGRDGVIVSTEIQDCDTPLLISLAAMEAWVASSTWWNGSGPLRR